MMKKTEIEEKADRIGRVLPPYITKLQHEVSSYIVREGLLPVPDKLLT